MLKLDYTSVKKNSFAENQNIFISGVTQNEEQDIQWEIIKI